MLSKNNKTVVFDLLLVLPFVIVASVCLIIYISNSQQGSYAEVEINGQPVGRYSLFKNAEYELNNGSNTLVIQDGYAMITEANCPDKICEKQGRINLQGQTIVCIPNKLVVKIVQQQGGVDLVI